ncbi:MAG: GNAT family N-acetyltransferase [Nocardioidaceae bacterium]
MGDLPPGWETDLCVLRHAGSVIEDLGDHLVVRSPSNPDFHWGNFVFVMDAGAVHDAERWVRTFQSAFPTATWLSIGLIAMPDQQQSWTDQGLDLELDEVLTTSTLPRQTSLDPRYSVRRLAGDDWEQYVARSVAENHRTDEHDPDSFARFAAAQAQVRRALSERDVGAFFGAFMGDTLAADLGIVRCGSTARYQSVGTDAAHRRRGLASHLLGVAARWSAGHGCNRWVILTETTNPAGRVYRRVGFEPGVGNAQAYRKPPR